MKIEIRNFLNVINREIVSWKLCGHRTFNSGHFHHLFSIFILKNDFLISKYRFPDIKRIDQNFFLDIIKIGN
jgi:hypothetical protein